ASPSARLYVEPQALFAAHHRTYDAQQALAVLRSIAQRKHQWSDILSTTKMAPASLKNIMETLVGDLGLVERVLPVTEQHQTRSYHTQYHLTDNFLKFWFEFIEPNQGNIEFGSGERIVDAIFARLPDHMGLVFESMCRDWVRLAASANLLPVEVGRVGTWWNPNHQIDIVGLDRAGKAILVGESKWTNQPFDWSDMAHYLDHVRALGDTVDPGALHLIFSKSGFQDNVVNWAEKISAKLLTPADMLSPFV
ncbi:MAG: DUF234 domain-containing protein, partial [Dehalococcoidia bacterium]|nr:DUF234 domain-containing protein [Dehalococcoidia bacterium]